MDQIVVIFKHLWHGYDAVSGVSIALHVTEVVLEGVEELSKSFLPPKFILSS